MAKSQRSAQSSRAAKFSKAKTSKSSSSSSVSSGGSGGGSSVDRGADLLESAKTYGLTSQGNSPSQIQNNIYSSAGSTPTYGTKGQSVLDLQKSLNKQYAGVAGYTPLKEDSYFGPLTLAATKFKAPAQSPTNPIISGTRIGSEVDSLSRDIDTMYDSSGLRRYAKSQNSLIENRLSDLERQYQDERNSIRSDYKASAAIQGEDQKKDYAGRATGLITSGGGFLGTTQSHEGVLQDLSNQHEIERQSLMSKRDAALQEAANAFADKQYALAKEQLQVARETESEIYSRQKDFAEQKLALSREKRAQTEFDLGLIDKRIEAYSAMDDEEFANVDTSEEDKFYFPGFTARMRDIAIATAEGKSIENDIDLRNKLQTLINKTPAGQKIVLPDGSTYVGMKKSGTGQKAGSISIETARNIGIPSIAGMDESDVILSLSFDNPANWFQDWYKKTYPEYAEDMNNVRAEWEALKAEPDIEAYKNSAVVTSRIADSSNPLANISSEDIAAALAEE